jgi:hypothetical protein
MLLKRLKTTTSMTISWVKGHNSGNVKSIPRILSEAAHDLANNFLHKDQGYYNPNKATIDPPSFEASILYDKSTIMSNLSTILKKHFILRQYKMLSVRQRSGPMMFSTEWTRLLRGKHSSHGPGANE